MHTIFDDMVFKNPHAQDGALIDADEMLEIDRDGGEHPAVVLLLDVFDTPRHLQWSKAIEFIRGTDDVEDYLPDDFVLEFYDQYGHLPVGDFDVIEDAPHDEIGQEQLEALGYSDSILEYLHAYFDYEAFGRDMLTDYDSTKNYHFREL